MDPRLYNLNRWFFFAEAMTLMVLAALAVRFLPFSRTIALCSLPLPSKTVTETRRSEIIYWTTRMVKSAMQRSPLRALCFEQGLTAQIMLRRRGIGSTLFYGVALSPNVLNPLHAHVWVEADGVDICGGAYTSDYTILLKAPVDAAVSRDLWALEDGA